MNTTPTTRSDIREFFKSLRKADIKAHMNFSCCGSCAGYELATKYDDGTPVVYFHRQSNERAFRGGDKLSGQLPLYYSYTNGEIDMNCKRLGESIVTIAVSHGLIVDWNGQANTAIYIETEKLAKEEN